MVRESGSYSVALKYSMENIFGCKPGDVFLCASDIGWVVGHSYIVYGPLMNRTTTILYEGKPVGTPDSSSFWRMIQQYKVNHVFTAPTAIRAIKKEDPAGRVIKAFDTSSLVNFFVAVHPSVSPLYIPLQGERCDTDSLRHFSNLLGVPVRDHYWQTESGIHATL